MSDQEKKHFLTSAKMWVSAPNPNAGGKFAKLGVGVWMGNPSFILKTNDPAHMNKEGKFGNIEARMDLITFMSALELLEMLIADPTPDRKYKVMCKNHPRVDGQRSDEIIHVSDLVFGRGGDGVLYASVLDATSSDAKKRIKVQFDLPEPRYHSILSHDGKIAEASIRSNVAARGYVNIWRHFVPDWCAQTYEPPKPPQFRQGGGGGGNFQRNGGGGGGNYQRNNNSGGGNFQRNGGGNAPSGGGDDYDNDIPF